MNLNQLEATLRAADPIAGDEPLPSIATTIADARRRASTKPTTLSRPYPRLALAAAVAVVVAMVIAVPVISGDHAPQAQAIRMVAFKAPSSIELPFGVAVAPAGWHIAASKPGGTDGFGGVVTLAPAGKGVSDNWESAIFISKYAELRQSFSTPRVWQCPGPIFETTSNGRLTSLMLGNGENGCGWQAQIELPGGGEFFVQASSKLTREQFQTFLDGLAAKPRS